MNKHSYVHKDEVKIINQTFFFNYFYVARKCVKAFSFQLSSPRSYDSWIYIYMCSHELSQEKLWVRYSSM